MTGLLISLFGLLGIVVFCMAGLVLYEHDLATRCIGAGMQWVGGSCLR